MHRVQGQSLESAVIDLKGHRQDGLYYVAMSRLITEAGLYLRNFKQAEIQASTEVQTEYARLEAEASLHLHITQLKLTGDHHFVLTVLNARSLHANIENVRAHHNMLQSSVLVITKTWANRSDSNAHYSIPGFDMYRQDNTVQSFDQRPQRGVMAYSKHCSFTVKHSVQHNACDMVCAVVTTKYLCLNLLTVYRSPQLPMARFLAIAGQQSASHAIKQCLHQCGQLQRGH